jgi:predicted nuclease of predicted toxin-antitoxin system
MSVPLLLDEHVEHEVYHRLQKYGYEVEHIHFHDTLQKGDEDHTLADYSLANGVLVVTYDDDFQRKYDHSEYWGVLLLSDDDWSAVQVADTIHQILDLYDEPALQQMNVVGREWL